MIGSNEQRLLRNITGLVLALFLGLGLTALTLLGLQASVRVAKANPIPPPGGYPKLQFSVKTVTPTLAATGGATLYYHIEIRNTGAYSAPGTTLSDTLPPSVTYNNNAQASAGPAPSFDNGTLSWTGEVGFDTSVIVSFSVSVDPGYSGVIENLAVIEQAQLSQPVTVSAVTTVTDSPILAIHKSADPRHPGPEKPLTYTLVVVNQGQPAVNLPITVTDQVPANTSLRSIGPDGVSSPANDVVTWTRNVNLDLGERSVFEFSVDVGDVPSGTVLTNQTYQVTGQGLPVSPGKPLTTTVIDPIFLISKSLSPDPPGSNREMTYTLSVLNKGSLATDLVVTDQVPAGVSYVRGGSLVGNTVSWALSRLAPDESAEFSFTVAVPDVADVPIVNDTYEVCSAEDVCTAGEAVTSLVLGPSFVTSASLDPIAKKPGGGTGPVTPTLVVHNAGPGSALNATAYLEFGRISVSLNDLIAIPSVGAFSSGPDCGDNCVAYSWVGSIGAEETITLTTQEGQSTIGGAEGTNYTATVVITDTLSNMVTEPITSTAYGKITHLANLVPTKSAPPVVGAGLTMTYTINVWNSGLSTDEPPPPALTDTVPASVTLVNISHSGTSEMVNGETVVSWNLPGMSPGDTVNRSYSVLVDGSLLSGTQIVNEAYRASWYEDEDTTVYSNTGPPVTTTVSEVGLIDSYKMVTPTVAFPGPGNVLTYSLHIVNSSPSQLNGVNVYDTFPWEDSTYQRDAIASAGSVISDIVSLRWSGDLAPFTEEVITFTVLVDPEYEGPITNTATITHASLRTDVEVRAVAWITDDPVLRITKIATPDPVLAGSELEYTIRVRNLGQQASELLVSDRIPDNTTYVPGSGGALVGDQVQWTFSVLNPGETREFTFRVLVEGGRVVVNADYQVSSAEGATAAGTPVITIVRFPGSIYLPFVIRNAP